MNVAVLPLLRATIADDVPRQHDLVGAFHQILGVEVDLALSAGGDLVKVGRGLDAAFGHSLGHLGPEVHKAVGGRAGEVAQSRACLVAQVGTLDRPRFQAPSVESTW